MKSWPLRALLLAAAAVVAGLPALSQESEAPKSLLPPGFGDPETLPPPVESPPAQRVAPPTAPPPSATSRVEEGESEADDSLDRSALRPLNYFTVPEGAGRPIMPVGILQPGNFGLAPDAFGRANGVFLTALMHRLDAPLPSRWASILLRRALLSRLDTPSLIHPVDWVAARADLLLQMGEADAARMLVQSVDVENYTPRMVGVAGRVALATADPAGLCPLENKGDSTTGVWKLAEAMCAALEGEPARAAAIADEVRRRGEARGIDLQLAEKVIGAGAQSRRAVTIEWEDDSELTPWRFGLAAATGLEIPAPLVGQASPPIRAWMAAAPMIPLDQRVEAAQAAAALGVFSSQSLVAIHSLLLDQTDPADVEGTVGARLRTAWTDSDEDDRILALRDLWQEPTTPVGRHARLILTAGAAARITPSDAHVAEAANLIASMLTAGIDRQATRWMDVVESARDFRSWGMLAIAAPSPRIDPEMVEAFVQEDVSIDRRRGQMLVAALVGLGRIEGRNASRLASAAGLQLGGGDRWSRTIDSAARDRAPGTVVLLTAVGMQTGDWSGVPPAYLFRMVRALTAVGLEYDARMIAAEALARL